ncbi:GNAT family N-acetyltransferase [Deinococcus maricopensis]|uniref:GNAT family N-acetyltransferase n=1 Tax=Deinococcus maricopensis TaxID=309887 RepID=UPI00145E20EA|nr:GNAT family N-acetyltransferase [Deinococcus maricopensis]
MTHDAPTPAPLDTPVLAALTGPHAHLAEVHGGARRYPPRAAPFGAVLPGAEADLLGLLRPGETVTLVGEHAPPPGLTRVVDITVHQMHLRASAPDLPGDDILPLTPADLPDMLDLVRLTRPGPLRPGAFDLGAFWGVRDAGRLVALTGTRFHAPGARELTAVCTHPDARGRGHAARLVAHAARHLQALGETPFLHVYTENRDAARVYARLGFLVARTLPIRAYAHP